MGLLKLALYSAVAFYSFRSVQRVARVAVKVSVPRGSLLDKVKGSTFKDAYRASAQIKVKGKKKQASSTVPVLASHFFSCPVFANFERHLLKIVLRCPEPDLESSNFLRGEKFYVWTVLERTEEEILLGWEAPFNLPLSGTTW